MFSRIKEVTVAVRVQKVAGVKSNSQKESLLRSKSASAHSPVEEGLVLKAGDECGGSELVDRFPELPLDQHDLHLGLQWRIDLSFSHRLNSSVTPVD